MNPGQVPELISILLLDWLQSLCNKVVRGICLNNILFLACVSWDISSIVEVFYPFTENRVALKMRPLNDDEGDELPDFVQQNLRL